MKKLSVYLLFFVCIILICSIFLASVKFSGFSFYDGPDWYSGYLVLCGDGSEIIGEGFMMGCFIENHLRSLAYNDCKDKGGINSIKFYEGCNEYIEESEYSVGCEGDLDGKDIFTKGNSISVGTFSSQDKCLDKKNLIEYWCKTAPTLGDIMVWEEIECENSCVDGSCVEKEKLTPPKIIGHGDINTKTLCSHYQNKEECMQDEFYLGCGWYSRGCEEKREYYDPHTPECFITKVDGETRNVCDTCVWDKVDAINEHFLANEMHHDEEVYCDEGCVEVENGPDYCNTNDSGRFVPATPVDEGLSQSTRVSDGAGAGIEDQGVASSTTPKKNNFFEILQKIFGWWRR
jgi:hypothetical protein